ncbi:MAG: thioredoxin domain-containing protein [Halobacteriales archaeon SW_8_66_22]|nr:MAG: thioredoxin domain-containing protein [Halobacteriales archaeon SW_8_66_22]
MSTRASENRLDEEESPYLRAHADNPVHWQPWDEQALQEARERDDPIFLSVGYSACHWCHVMAEESFDDEAVAEILNEQFVPIKVDREERPDVDRIYQTICQQVSGRGGWPLSVWLTPDQRPFQVGTYFPKEPKRGMPGFTELLKDIANSWSDPEEREQIENRAEKWTDALAGELESVPDKPREPEEDVAETAAKAAVRAADRDHGGWGSGPKFPQTGRIHLLLRAHKRTDRDVYREVATEALDAMAAGGMYDHVGGGFHRYATDRDWTVPHFEKMLYDNAELPRAYLAGYQVTGDERYLTVATETFDFIQRELTHEDGGFFSTLDAQSENESGEREEGAFYVWTPGQVEDAVDDEIAASLLCDRYGVTDRGNFEGTTVLTIEQSIDDLAAEYGMDADAVREALDEARQAVAAARDERPRPLRDEKVLAGWNGLAISAFAEAAIVADESFADPAADALSFCREHLWDADEGRLTRRYTDGVTKIDGYLEDYAFLGRGALDLFQATGEVEHLAFALDLARAIERAFWDADDGTLYFTPVEGESLIARPQERTDQSTPSSMGVAAELLDTLSVFTTDDAFATVAESVVETQGDRIWSNPLQHASLTLAADTVTNGAFEVTLVADDPPAEWREEVADRHLGSRVLAWRPASEDRLEAWLDALDLPEAPPVWADRGTKNDKPTVYVCRDFACSPPRNEIERALDWGGQALL